MIKNGKGGGNTKTGLVFEGKTDLATFLNSQEGYQVTDGVVFYNDKKVARIFKKHGFYRYRKNSQHFTVSRILEIVKAFQLVAATGKGQEEVEKVTAQVQSYEQIKELISVDTLKTMQLLGFNYKAAIGEPLTQICANAITNIGNKKSNQKPQNKGR